jgi:hypothetical protein
VSLNSLALRGNSFLMLLPSFLEPDSQWLSERFKVTHSVTDCHVLKHRVGSICLDTPHRSLPSNIISNSNLSSIPHQPLKALSKYVKFQDHGFPNYRSPLELFDRSQIQFSTERRGICNYMQLYATYMQIYATLCNL